MVAVVTACRPFLGLVAPSPTDAEPPQRLRFEARPRGAGGQPRRKASGLDIALPVVTASLLGSGIDAWAKARFTAGFPTGISGMALMARAYNQTQKFGVEMAIPDEVIGLKVLCDRDEGRFVLKLSNNGTCHRS
jgi:thioredoxin reductase (NADPH)